MDVEGGWSWVVGAVGCKFLISVFLVLLGKQLAVEHIFEYNRSMELGEPTATTCEPCSRLDEAFGQFDAALTDLITGVSTPNANSAITTDTADGKTPQQRDSVPNDHQRCLPANCSRAGWLPTTEVREHRHAIKTRRNDRP